jgi:hypothetical protein
MPAQEALIDAKTRLEPYSREENLRGPNKCQVDDRPEGTPAADPRALASRDVSDLGDCLQPRAEMDHPVKR